MTTFLAAQAAYMGSGVDPLATLVVAGLATLVLMVWLVRYASRRSREEAAAGGHESSTGSREFD